MKARFLLLLCSLSFSMTNLAARPGADQLEQLSWLTGCWKGTGLGGEVEECWMKSSDERYTGVFQMVNEGKQQFSELVMIAEFDGQFAMRVKHFDPGLDQWESDNTDGVTFPFVELGENYIQFEGLRYELTGETCHVTLDMKHGDGIRQVKFVYERM